MSHVTVGWATLLCPPLAGIYTAWAQTTVPTLPNRKNFANNYFPKCGHPFVLSLSKHEWVIASFGTFRPSFDKLRTKGKFYREVSVGRSTLFCPPLAGVYAAWAQTTVPTLPSCKNFANNYFPKCGHPFVLSLSKHEWVIASFGTFRPSFDKLRTNGKFYREVSVGRSTLFCPPLAGVYTAWAQTTVPTLPSSKNFANNHFPKCGHPFMLSLSKHEWVTASFGTFRPSFDKLRTNGKFYREVSVGRSTLLCPPIAGVYSAWAQTTVPTLPNCKNFANDHFPKCGHPFVLSLSKDGRKILPGSDF